MGDANGQCCIGDAQYRCSLVDNSGEIPYHLRDPEEKLADREKELSALKDTCREIKLDLQSLEREIKGFASMADNSFYLSIMRGAEKDLDEAIEMQQSRVPKLEETAIKYMYKYELANLLLEQLK